MTRCVLLDVNVLLALSWDHHEQAQWAVVTDSLRGRRQVTDLQLVNVAADNDAVLATFDAGILQALRPQEKHLVEVWR